MEFLERLQCPITKNGLELINQTDFSTPLLPHDYIVWPPLPPIYNRWFALGSRGSITD